MDRVSISSVFDPRTEVTLYEGDCLDMLATVPEQSVQLIITSPPYNLGKPYEERLHLQQYIDQQRRVIEECVRVLNDSGSICWQVGNYVNNGRIVPLDVILYDIFASLGLQLRNRIIWQFGHGLHASRRFSGRYEVILWFTKTDSYTFNLDPVRVPQKYPEKKYFKGAKKGQLSGNPLGKNPTDIWDIPNVKANHVEKTTHPCQFPVELVERLVLALSDEEDYVLDPFMGVGSTAIAALIHGRKVIGSEIVPEYAEIARKRLSLAEQGQLLVRPMERSVYDPSNPKANVPPKKVQLSSTREALRLLESQVEYPVPQVVE